jgi:hypothetical protein
MEQTILKFIYLLGGLSTDCNLDLSQFSGRIGDVFSDDSGFIGRGNKEELEQGKMVICRNGSFFAEIKK